MGTKLNWGAALNSLADSLRTYAAMQQREQDIKQEREFQLKRDRADQEARFESQKALEGYRFDLGRGEQLGNVPMATGQMGSYGSAGGFPIPRVEGKDVPVYRQDLEGTGSLLGRRLAQLQGWGEKETPKREYAFPIGGQTVYLEDEDFAEKTMQLARDRAAAAERAAAAAKERTPKPVDLGGIRTYADSAYGPRQTSKSHYDATRGEWVYSDPVMETPRDVAEATGVWELVNQRFTEIAQANPQMQPEIAFDQAFREFFGEPGGLADGLAGALGAVPGLLPRAAVKRPGWFDDTGAVEGSWDKMDSPELSLALRKIAPEFIGASPANVMGAVSEVARGTMMSPAATKKLAKEALGLYTEFSQDWEKIIEDGSVTPDEIDELQQKYGFSDEQEFHYFLSQHNETRLSNPKSLIDALTPGPEGK